MKAAEVREFTTVELESKLADLKKELFALRFQHAVNHGHGNVDRGYSKRCAPHPVFGY